MMYPTSNSRGWTESTSIDAIGRSVLNRFALPVLLAGTILFVDILFPLGVAGGVPYVALVLLGLTSSYKNDIFVFAAVGSALTVVGYYLSSEGGIHWMVLINRGLALFAIGVTAILCYRQKTTQERLEISYDQLEKVVEERTVALRKSEKQSRDLVDSSLLAIQIVGKDGKRIYANQAFISLLGYATKEEVLSLPVGSISGCVDHSQIRQFRETRTAGEQLPFFYEFDARRKDGSTVPVQAFSRPIVWEGESAQQRIYIDLTDRKNAEEKLRQAQKMEAVGQLTGGVAHDFNNLLMVIHGNIELIAERVADPTVGRMAESAMRAAGRGAELTQRLLAFSRKQALAPAVIALDQLVAGMANLMSRTLGEAIEIEVKGVEGLWQCRVDPSQLESALLNLALNARDAMPQGGMLTIETANIKLDDTNVAAQNDVSPGDYVQVSVSDTGTGMTHEVIEHAFEPFFTTKDVGAGSGLGLSMVHGFIKQSGGFVTIDSTKGVGTKLNLYLPRSVKTCAPVRRGPKRKDPVSQGEKILVVEDDPEVRVLTVSLLAGLGYDTVEAADGKQAIEALQQTPGIDLLFTDIGLPGGMSGVDVAREATRRCPGIKILFTSGYAEEALVLHGMVDAQVDLVSKPFRKGELAQKLRSALDASPTDKFH